MPSGRIEDKEYVGRAAADGSDQNAAPDGVGTMDACAVSWDGNLVYLPVGVLSGPWYPKMVERDGRGIDQRKFRRGF